MCKQVKLNSSKFWTACLTPGGAKHHINVPSSPKNPYINGGSVITQAFPCCLTEFDAFIVNCVPEWEIPLYLSV